MATYRYPTPPPTTSPKNDLTSTTRSYTPDGRRRPAQESYLDSTSYSAPTSPPHDTHSSQWTNSKPTPFAIPEIPHYLNSSFPEPKPFNVSGNGTRIVPPHQGSSPLIPSAAPHKQSPNPPYNPSTTSDYTRQTRTSPPLRIRSPLQGQNPIYYSPTNPVPSPYSASRPKPRPGFIKRILLKIESYIRSFVRWSKRNPIKAGLLTFIPVLGLAGIVRLVGGLGKLVGGGKTGIDKLVERGRKGIKDGGGVKKNGKQSWGWGLDDFVGFNGSKGGPVDGMLRICQMWV